MGLDFLSLAFTFTGLLISHFSFTSYSYKLGLIRMLVERAYKINKTWLGFHEDITKLTKVLQKNLSPFHLVENIINRYLTFTRHDCLTAISHLPSLTLHVPFTLNYLKLILLLSSRRKIFAFLPNVIVITLILS